MDAYAALDLFNQYRYTLVHGRYIHLEHLEKFIQKGSSTTRQLEILGLSENGQQIYSYKAGSGSTKVLLWSQMHGNESTTTKAVLDLLTLLENSTNTFVQTIKKKCTLYIIPILNPDGAQLYTRANYNKVDLNRDAKELTQRESKIFMDYVQKISPDYGFNLHGQRTIFSAGASNNSATVSFLAPAGDASRSILPQRKKSMEIISHMNRELQKIIPGCVGRYDDGFNDNCTGDALTIKQIPIILFEAGHVADDYDREVVRKYIFASLLTGLDYIATREVTGDLFEAYFEIPENEKLFYDIIIRDVLLDGDKVSIAIQYQERLLNNEVKFVPFIKEIGNLQHYYGHREIDGKGREITPYNDIVGINKESKLLRFCLDHEVFSAELDKF